VIRQEGYFGEWIPREWIKYGDKCSKPSIVPTQVHNNNYLINNVTGAEWLATMSKSSLEISQCLPTRIQSNVYCNSSWTFSSQKIKIKIKIKIKQPHYYLAFHYIIFQQYSPPTVQSKQTPSFFVLACFWISFNSSCASPPIHPLLSSFFYSLSS
jgi:hypothetical protein